MPSDEPRYTCNFSDGLSRILWYTKFGYCDQLRLQMNLGAQILTLSNVKKKAYLKGECLTVEGAWPMYVLIFIHNTSLSNLCHGFYMQLGST